MRGSRSATGWSSTCIGYLKTSNPARQQTWLICPDSQFAVCQQAVGLGKAGPDGKRPQLTVCNSEQGCQKCGKSPNNSKIFPSHGLPFVSPRSMGGTCLNQNQMDVSTGLGSLPA